MSKTPFKALLAQDPATQIPQLQDGNVWDRHLVLEALKECVANLQDEATKRLLCKKSLQKCHHRQVSSLMLSKDGRVRCFLTYDSPEGWCSFDPSNPHAHNSEFTLHNHRYPLTSIPLEGHQENIIYEEVDNETTDENIAVYKKYKFHSKILNPNVTNMYEYVADVKLSMTKYEVNQPWSMAAPEIHRIVWKGAIIAVLFEHREPSQINCDATDAYLSQTSESVQCMNDGLYQPLEQKEFDEAAPRVLKAIERYLSQCQ